MAITPSIFLILLSFLTATIDNIIFIKPNKSLTTGASLHTGTSTLVLSQYKPFKEIMAYCPLKMPVVFLIETSRKF